MGCGICGMPIDHMQFHRHGQRCVKHYGVPAIAQPLHMPDWEPKPVIKPIETITNETIFDKYKKDAAASRHRDSDFVVMVGSVRTCEDHGILCSDL